MNLWRQALKEYKPKAIKTLRKYVFDLIEHCNHVSNSKYFGCHTCPFNVLFFSGKFGCYFEQLQNTKPAEWEMNKMGSVFHE